MSMEKIQLTADYNYDSGVLSHLSAGWRGQVKIGDSHFGSITNVGPADSEIEILALVQNEIQKSLAWYIDNLQDVARGFKTDVAAPVTGKVSEEVAA